MTSEANRATVELPREAGSLAPAPVPATRATEIAEHRLCVTCGDPFTLTVGNRDFFLGRGLALPRRCVLCRALHRLDDRAGGVTLRVGDRVHVDLDGAVFAARITAHSQKPRRLVLESTTRERATGDSR